MAYPYNGYYNPQFPAMPMQQYSPVPQPQSGGINWVQGETGAKAFSVAPGQSAMLMDSEDHRFYIKSVDTAGIPSLRVFDFTERVAQPQTKNAGDTFVTREEFAALKAAVEALRGGADNAQSPA